MSRMVLGKKLGMTRVFDENGASIPVTVIEVGPCVVTQLRTGDVDGYTAVQIGYGDIKPRNSTIPMIGHDAKAGSGPKRVHREFRVGEDDLGSFEVGQTLTASDIAEMKFVDVTATSKGKGFAGTMKRHNFKGQLASHGVERKHRSPGSIGGHANERGGSGGPKKGKKMAGRLGGERVTVRSIPVVRVDAEQNLLLVKGPIPGPAMSTVTVREAVRLNRSKAKALAGS